MNGISESGYDVIIWLQQFSPTLDPFFKATTTLGAEQLFILFLPLVFWCIDKRMGARLGLLLLLSGYVNLVFKELLNQPRPSPDRVKVLAEETTPGLPSGHSQNSVVVFGYLAAQVRQLRVWLVAGLITFIVGVSRIYLGVHFPSDVLAGWLIGIVLLALYIWIEPEVEDRLRPWPWRHKMALALVVPLFLFLVYANAHTAQLMGVAMGLMAGFLIELRWIGFSARGPLWQRVLRFVVGAVILIVIWLGTRVLLPTEPETTALILRLLRYTLVGAWASLGAPWVFVSVGLATRESEAWA